MNFLRTSWYFSKWCAGCLRDFLLSAVWLGLAGLLLMQIGLLFSHNLPMPEWIIRQIESRIDAAGLRVKIESATIDTAGRVSIKNLQLTPHSLDSPLIKADEVYVRLNPLALLARHADPRYVRASGVDLLLPAMLSPTGRTEAVLSNIHLAFKPDEKEIALDQFSGRLANLTFSVRGLLVIPKDLTDGSSKKGMSAATLSLVIKTYVDIARKISEIAPELAALESPHLELELTPGSDDLPIIAFTLTSKKADIDLARFRPESGRLLISDLKLSTKLAPFATSHDNLTLQGSCSDAHTTKGYQLLGVNFTLKGEPPSASSPFKPLELLIKADSATQTVFNGVDLKNTLVRLRTGKRSPLSTEIITEAIGTSWHAEAETDPKLGQGGLKLEGAVTPFVIQLLETKTHMKPNTLLSMKAPAPITLTADFAPGWKLQKVLGRASFGPVVGYHVPFSGGTARFRFDGTELSVTDIDATQGDHAAVGSYWMNIKTLDFRFLLTGHLRPMGIAGFFDTWWSNFFNLFDFTPAAPAASVDIGGRWKLPHTTTVFVNADARHPTINHVQFDRVRTTMFIRPDFYDALEFIVNEGEQTARGTFTRTVDFYRHGDNLRTIDFDLKSTLDLVEPAKIFGPEGTSIVEPFTFANPPTLQLAGHIDGIASAAGPHRSIQMALTSTGGFALHRFPLSDLSFVGTIKDDTIDLHEIQVAYARGLAQGKIFLSGPEAERRLNFDIALKGAYLGEAVTTGEQFIASQKGDVPSSNNRFQQIPDVRLNLTLAAKGLYHEPLSFQGQGSVDLSGAQLAKINLLGSLSKALSKNTAFSFTTLQLNHAQSSLVLDREKLSLPDMKISGSATIIEGSGTYQLDKKNMDFTAKVYPFGQGKTLLSSAVGFVLVPLSNALELKLSGTLEQPNWRFAYGPRNFLYNITGTNPNDAAIIPEQTPTDITRRLPPPYLRR